MTQFRFLPILCFLLLGPVGCSSDAPSNATPSEPTPKAAPQGISHPAAEVADQVLAAIHAGDVKTLKSHFNEANRGIVEDDLFIEFMDGAKKLVADVRHVSEIRNDARPGFFLAKIRSNGNKVVLLILELESDVYRLEDINTAPVNDYEKMTIVNSGS